MSHLHLALALGDASGAPEPWADLVAEAEGALLDLVTLDVDPHGSRGSVADELGAVRAATRLAETTSSIGLLPTVRAGLSEPGRLARAVDELDRASGGRAGVLLQVPVPADEEGWVQAVRRRWSAGGASARGLRPVVALPGRPGHGHRTLPAAAADLRLVTPRTTVDVQQLLVVARTAGAPGHLLGDLVVVLDDDARRARDRSAHLAASTASTPTSAPEGTRTFAGTPAQLADLAQAWRAAGLAGLRLHPAEPARDLRGITRGLVPELQRRGAFRRSAGEPGLRERLAADARGRSERRAA